MLERADWKLFIDPSTLPQKAGCQPHELRRVVLKEIVDNALDNGAHVTIDRVDQGDLIGFVITDDGLGIDPGVPRLFSVNRPLRSNKLKRLPLRGMLGNGVRVVVGAVSAFGGYISVTSSGRRRTLAIDRATGSTNVIQDDPAEIAPDPTDAAPARLSIAIGKEGRFYTGPSRPEWFGPRGLHALFVYVVPDAATVAEVMHDVFGLDHTDPCAADDLSLGDVAARTDRARRELDHSAARLRGRSPRRALPKAAGGAACGRRYAVLGLRFREAL
jgi:hypothetical protein